MQQHIQQTKMHTALVAAPPLLQRLAQSAQRALGRRRRAMIGRIDDRAVRRVVVELIQLVQVGPAGAASTSGGHRFGNEIHVRCIGKVHEQQRKGAKVEFEHVLSGRRQRSRRWLLLLQGRVTRRRMRRSHVRDEEIRVERRRHARARESSARTAQRGDDLGECVRGADAQTVGEGNPARPEEERNREESIDENDKGDIPDKKGVCVRERCEMQSSNGEQGTHTHTHFLSLTYHELKNTASCVTRRCVTARPASPSTTVTH